MNNVNRDKSYFEVHIEKDGTYYITEEQKKSKDHDSAISTLKNIERIIAGNLKYSNQHQDKFSTLSECNRLKLFKEKSQEINKRYQKAATNSNWLFRMLFSQEEKVNAAQTRIENLIKSSEFLPLPNDVIQNELAKYLNVSDIVALSELNRDAKKQTVLPMIKRAQEFGYEGTDDVGATKYVKGFFNEVNLLCELKLIPEECVVYNVKKGFFINDKQLDCEATYRNLKNLTTENLSYLFAKLIACKSTRTNRFVVGFLLQNGADPNIPNNQNLTSLDLAQIRKNQKVIEILKLYQGL